MPDEMFAQVGPASLDKENIAEELGLEPATIEKFPERVGRERWNRGLFHTFRLKGSEPDRDQLLHVFPFPSPPWLDLVLGMLDFEVKAWRAWWSLQPDKARADQPVLDFPPLRQPVNEIIRSFLISQGHHQFPSMIRPFIEWPDLESHPMAPTDVRRLWKEDLRPTLDRIWAENRFPASKLRTDIDIGQINRCQLLSNNHRLVSTCWRIFHADYHALQLGRQLRMIRREEDLIRISEV